MTAFLVVLHILVSLFLVLFVLLQPGARGGVGAAFGGAGGQTVFGGRGANTFLAKLTAAAAVIFMLTSISLSYFGSSSVSVMAKRGKTAAAAPENSDPATEGAAANDASGSPTSAGKAATDPAGETASPAAPSAPAAPASDADKGNDKGNGAK
jgi:preprotein translocase subunit SecG